MLTLTRRQDTKALIKTFSECVRLLVRYHTVIPLLRYFRFFPSPFFLLTGIPERSVLSIPFSSPSNPLGHVSVFPLGSYGCVVHGPLPSP